MRRTILLLVLIAMAVLAPRQAGAQSAAQTAVGIAAPLSGDFALLGEQLVAGARLAARNTPDIRIETADTACNAEGGKAAAEALINAQVGMVVGFMCTEAIEAALPLFAAAQIPVITPAVRTDSLTDQKARTNWPLFRLAPRADAEREAVARLLLPRWRDALFAIADDGTIHGRELAESLRLAAEQQELKPVFVDTFRPQLDNQIGLAGRLRRAGATHAFIGGERDDIAILARDARKLDYALTLVGGETLRAAAGDIPLAEGVLMVGLPRWADIAAPETLSTFAEEGVVPEGYALPAHAAMEVAIAANEMALKNNVSLGETLSLERFSTAIGTTGFDSKGDASFQFYRLFRFDGENFVEIDP